MEARRPAVSNDNVKPHESGNSRRLREGTLREILIVLMRGKWIVLACVLLVTLIAALVTMLTEPTYESVSLILVGNKGGEAALPFLDLTGTSPKLVNELETLKSLAVAEAVARRLLQRGSIDSARGQGLNIAAGVKKDSPGSIGEVVKRLQKHVEITAVKESDIIRLLARSPGRQEAQLILSTYIDVFGERNREMTLEKSKAVREFLQDQVKSKREALNGRDSSLQDYMRKSNVVSLDEETKRLVEQIAQLEAAQGGLDVEISVKRNTLNAYVEELRKLEPNVAKSMGEYGDTYIKLLQDQLAKLEVQRDVAVTQNAGGEGMTLYPEQIKAFDAQMATLRKKLEERTKEYLSSMVPGSTHPGAQDGSTGYLGEVKQKLVEQRIELSGLLARKEALERVLLQTSEQFDQLPRKTIALAQLQRARLSSEKLYLMVEERFNEASIKEHSEFAEIAVIDPPSIPEDPISPRVALNIMLAALGGLAIGVAVVLIRAATDVRFHSPEDVTRHGYKLYATIRRIRWIKKDAKGRSGLREDGRWYDTRLVPLFHPFDPATESYRHLLTRLIRGEGEGIPKRIMFTSANPGEGKTTTLANLAVTAAQLRKRVLVIDADLRRPTLHKLFNIAPSPGLSDYIRGSHQFNEVVRVEVLENLDVICCGTQVENSARILTSWRLKEFLEKLAPAYDLFLFDTPPLLAVTDPALLCSSMDLSLIVVSGEGTRIDQLERADDTLKAAGARATGVVFNNYDIKKAYGGAYKTDLYSYTEYSYTSPGRKRQEPKLGKL